ncbi:NtaA/DmoA family FMN-dependent monooxygenase [Caryophanon tenue]|uniref:NtaA/DmoA family FMN-dependent monooxygenase n=1 Tax=Caryophanon tenue TaxID=33978 RepID=UPI000ACDF525
MKKKVHVVGHAGKHFNITGPLTIPQSKQGHPVIVQAGSSEPGRELAARTAEAIFTAWQSFEDAQAFYQDVKSRLAKYGRRTDELKILPGIFPVVGRTFEEAQAKHQQLLDYIPVEAGIARLSALIGFDLSSYNVDGYLPQAVFDGAATGHRSRVDIITKLARDENLTIRQLYQRISGGRGHYEIVGTPEYIADVLQHWFEHEAADGFNILAPTYPQGFDDFIELVLPELQRRGLFRTAYSGSTLREHFGLQKPVPVFL